MKSYLFLGLILTGGISLCLLLKLYRIRQQISLIKEVLEGYQSRKSKQACSGSR